MIQVKLASNNAYELTDKKTTVITNGATLKLQSSEINVPGEYETDGVEVVYGEQAALLVWERIQLVYIFNTATPKGFDREQFSSANIVILSPEISDATKDQITAILDVYDPSVVIFSKANKLDEAFKTTLKAQEAPVVKLTTQTLPVEGREVYELS